VLMQLRDPATSGLPALVGIYLFCIYLILFQPVMRREAPEAYLTPVVLGKSLEFWIRACNWLWASWFAVHLIALLQSGWRTQKVNLFVALVAIIGLLLFEARLSGLFDLVTMLRGPH